MELRCQSVGSEQGSADTRKISTHAPKQHRERAGACVQKNKKRKGGRAEAAQATILWPDRADSLTRLHEWCTVEGITPDQSSSVVHQASGPTSQHHPEKVMHAGRLPRTPASPLHQVMPSMGGSSLYVRPKKVRLNSSCQN
jgi:hypothetical protein